MAALDGYTIGFIGLGLMGTPMARNLHAAGAKLIVHNRSQAVVDKLVAEGMTQVNTPAEATAAGIVILMLSDTPAVEAVIKGPSGVLEKIGDGDLLIDMGTSTVSATRKLAAAVIARSSDYIDAPVSGGTIGAESGSLTIMAGGSESALIQAMPIFEVLGAKTTHVGDVGAGQIAKAANQIIVGLNIGAVAEALTLARRAGADPARVRAALSGGFADSRILEVHGQRMIDGAFAPGGKCVTQRKDMDQVLELAAELRLELPGTLLYRDLYDRVIADGHGELDHAALIKAIEPKS